MKLGAALNERARLAKRVSELRDLLDGSLVIQEGEETLADPNSLIEEALELIDQIADLVARINHTNSATALASGKTITEALANRDSLLAKISHFDFIMRKLGGNDPFAYRRSASELKQVRLLKLTDVRNSRDVFSRDLRLLEAELQELNWTTELV